MTTQNIFRSVAYRLPAILKQRLKLIPFFHVNDACEITEYPNLISCASVSLVQVKKTISVPTILGSKKKIILYLTYIKFLWL